MALDDTGTILTIRDADTDALDRLPLYSARGLSQTLDYVDGAMDQMDTVNGETVDLSIDRFRKLKTTISATDVRPPSAIALRPGLVVVVECAYIDSYPTIGGTPGRTPVSGSQFVEGNFTFYRPTLTMMVGAKSGRFEEWEAGYAWSIELREVTAGA